MTSPSRGHLLWIELLAHDVSAARPFYEQVFGWQSVDLPMEPQPYPAFLVGELPVAGMMQMPPTTPDDAPHQWLGYFGVDDADASAALAVAMGATTFVPPTDIPEVGRFTVLGDPSGATVALLQPPADRPSRGPSFPPPEGHVSWADLAVADLDAAMRFYGELLGWTPGERHDMGELGPYQIMQIQGQDFVGLYPTSAMSPVSQWTYYVNVDTVPAALARSDTAGGRTLMGPHQVPGGQYIALVHDPVGAMIAMVGPA